MVESKSAAIFRSGKPRLISFLPFPYQFQAETLLSIISLSIPDLIGCCAAFDKSMGLKKCSLKR
jgi:hypothetical protein